MNNDCGTPVGQNVAPRDIFTPELLECYSCMSADTPPPKSFKIGLLTVNLNTVGKIVYAIANPASPCVVSAVATLESVNADAIREWVRSKGLGPEHGDIAVGTGDSGLRDIIAGSDVDAIYVSLPLK